ncbi:hypothetical protein [Motiliproteus sp.]|uniref:hypothetical protein n=1 Tax=Motiliproteus sp. TaxID=1898955 RepID=UPI003BA9F969
MDQRRRLFEGAQRASFRRSPSGSSTRNEVGVADQATGRAFFGSVSLPRGKEMNALGKSAIKASRRAANQNKLPSSLCTMKMEHNENGTDLFILSF